jgi:hypothetical protein
MIGVVTASCLAPAVSGAVEPPAASAAQPASDAERARALKQQGDAAMHSLRYAEALAAYQASYALSPDPALLYNQGRAQQALGRFPEALANMEAFDRQAPPQLHARVPALAGLIAELRARVATVAIACNVPGARVLIRDTVVGKTPMPPLGVSAGKATIEIDAEGYFPYRRELELPGGGSLVVDAQLGSRARTGLLVVRTSVQGADVWVDGRALGAAPVETIVNAGTHRITAWHPEWKTTETSAALAVGERKEMTVSLKPRGITSKWWFWAGVGAVVVTGAVVTTALLTERDPASGDIPPGHVSGPLSPAFVRF